MAINMRKKKDEYEVPDNSKEAVYGRWGLGQNAGDTIKGAVGNREKQNSTASANGIVYKRALDNAPAIKGAALPGESPYKTPPSNYDIYPNTDYMADGLKAESEGRFNDAAYLFGMRDKKIDAGLGGGYAKFNPYQYNSKYGDKIADLRDQWENYEDFSYDPTTDEAYKALASVYSKNASDASANALAQAAAANGGRMSSNAVIASNLAYQNKMAGLEAVIPQLRDLAYQMYLGDKNDLRTSLNDYMYQEQQDYGRWADALDRRIENQRYANETAYNKARDEIMTFGKVMTQETAGRLGVPIGTAGSDALNAWRSYMLSVSEMGGEFTADVLNDVGWQNNPDRKTLAGKQFERGVYEDDRNYNYTVQRDAVDDARAERDFWFGAHREAYPDGGVPFVYNGVTYSNGGVPSSGSASGGSYGGGTVTYGAPIDNPTIVSANAEGLYTQATMNNRTDVGAVKDIKAAVQEGRITETDAAALIEEKWLK